MPTKKVVTPFLQEQFQIIHLEDAANSGLTNLPRVEQLELLGALVLFSQRCAISPLSDLDNLLSFLVLLRAAFFLRYTP